MSPLATLQGSPCAGTLQQPRDGSIRQVSRACYAYEAVDKGDGRSSCALCTRRDTTILVGLLVGLLVIIAALASSYVSSLPPPAAGAAPQSPHLAEPPPTLSALPSPPPPESTPLPPPRPPTQSPVALLPLPPEFLPRFGTKMPPNTSTCAWERLAGSASACTGEDCGSGDAFDAPVYRCMRDGVRSFIVGPFSSSVQQWYSIAASVALLRRGDRIIRYTGDAVHASDAATPMSYPPLHVHHIHVRHPDTVKEDSGHWWETHGDYARADGEYDYSLASPPAGRCVVFDDDGPLAVDAQFNDVRFSTGTAMAGDVQGSGQDEGRSSTDDHASASSSTLGAAAPSYAWFFRVAFEVERRTTSRDTPSCTPVHKLMLTYPVDEHALHDRLGRFDAGSGETVFVWTHKLPYGGTVAPPVHSHVHRARYAGHLLLRGEHTLAGLVGGRSGQSLSAFLASLPATNRTATVRQLVLNRARADGTLLCSDDPSAPTFVSRPEGGDGMGGVFDRRGRLECEPFSFGAGELVTVLLFSRPLWATELHVFPQHALMFIFYTPLDEASAPLIGTVTLHAEEPAWRSGYLAYTATDLNAM